MPYKVCDTNGNPITRSLPPLAFTITGKWVGNMGFRFYTTFAGCTAEAIFQGERADGARYVIAGIPGGNGATGPQFNSPPYDYSDPDDYQRPITYSLNGKITLSGITMELRCEPGSGSGGWYNSVPDAIPFAQNRYYWYILPDQLATMSISAGDLGAASFTGTMPAGEWDGSLVAEGFINWHDGGEKCLIECAITTDYPISGDVAQSTFTVPSTGCTYTTIAGGGQVYFAWQGGYAFPPGGYDLGVFAQMVAYPDIPIDAAYRINAMESLYSDAIQVSATLGTNALSTPVLATGSTGRFQATQRDYINQVQTSSAGEYKVKQEHTRGPVSLSITPTSLSAQGEDYVTPGYGVDTTSRITRLPFRGRPFPAIAITHAESYAVPNWNDLGHWIGTNGTTVSRDGSGNLVITAPIDRSGGATFIYPTDPATGFHHAVSCLSYRYLTVNTPENAPSPFFNVTIPPCSLPVWEPPGIGLGNHEDVYSGPETLSKRWDVVASATGLQGCRGDLDLCGPDFIDHDGTFVRIVDYPGISDGTFPLDRGTRWPIPSRMMPCQGVWRIEQLVLGGIPAGESLTVSSLALTRRNQPTYDGLDQWNRGRLNETQNGDALDPEWESGQTMPSSSNGSDSTVNVYERRGLLSIVDGKQAVEEAVFWYSLFQGGDSGITQHLFHTESIASLIDKINAADDEGILRYPGVTAQSLRPDSPSCHSYADGQDVLPDTCYFNETGAAAWLCNHNTSLGVVTDDSTGVATLYARPLFDQIIPCFGLDWSQFEAIAVLRGSVQGLFVAASDLHTSQAGALMELIETDDIPAGSANTLRGSSTTSSNGFFSTGAPFGRGPNVAHTLYSPVTTPNINEPFLAANWRTRYRHRAIAFSDYSLGCPVLLGNPQVFFPFTPQFSDPSATPNEEWRRTGGTGFVESAPASSSPPAKDTGNDESGM